MVDHKLHSRSVEQSSQEQLKKKFSSATSKQQQQFSQVKEYCLKLQRSVVILQKTLLSFSSKLRIRQKFCSSSQVLELKQRQDKVLIEELRERIRKVSMNEQYSQSILSKLQKENLSLKNCLLLAEGRLRQREVDSDIALEKLRKEFREKQKTIKKLTMELGIHTQKHKVQIGVFRSNNELPRNIQPFQSTIYNQSESQVWSEDGLQQLDKGAKYKDYTILQENLRKENKLLSETLKMVQQQSAKSNLKLNSTVFQLDSKLKKQTEIHKQLQNTMSCMLKKSSNLQVLLHQQVISLKKSVSEEKERVKVQEKQMEKALINFTFELLNKHMIFMSTNPIQQLEEIKKEIIKINKRTQKKAMEQYTFEIDRLTADIFRRDNTIRELQTANKKTFENTHRSSMSQLGSDNGSLGSLTLSFNPTGAQSIEKNEEIQHKYKIKLQNLRKQIKSKNNMVDQMQKELDDQSQTSNAKLITLQANFLAKNNECRKQQIIIQQLQIQLQNLEKTLTATIKIHEQAKQQLITNKTNLQKSLGQKILGLQEKLKTYRLCLREAESREHELMNRRKKLDRKMQQQQIEHKKHIGLKVKGLSELSQKNQQLIIQNKILNEKVMIAEDHKSKIISDRIQIQTLKKAVRKQILERDQLRAQLNYKNSQLRNSVSQKTNIEQQLLNQNIKIDKMQRKFCDLNQELKQGQAEKIRLELLYKESESVLSCLNFTHQQLWAKYLNLEHSLKQKQNEIAIINSNHNVKISQKEVRINQLMKIINKEYSHEQSEDIEQHKQNRQTPKFKQGSLNRIHSQQVIVALQKQQSVNTISTGINTLTTDIFDKGTMTNLTEFLVEDSRFQRGTGNILDALSSRNFQEEKSKSIGKSMVGCNLFSNLNRENNKNQVLLGNDDNFEIYQENQSINIGQTAEYMRIRDIFNKLRLGIEKLLNQSECEIQYIQELPHQVQSDYEQFITYVKSKIRQIKDYNELSFIGVIVGNQPLDNSLQLNQFCYKDLNQAPTFERVNSQKQDNSLMMSQPTPHITAKSLSLENEYIRGNTNQKQLVSPSQIYLKHTLEQSTKVLDILQQNFQSMKNIVRNVCEIWIADSDMENDFKNNMDIYFKVGSLENQQRFRLKYYIQRYIQLKGFH